MQIVIKTKDTDNIIGLKEDIAMRLEGVVDIERIDVQDVQDVQDGKDFYSPEEVRSMTPKQIRINYQSVINSMQLWNRKEQTPCKT